MNYKALSLKVMRVFELADKLGRKFILESGLDCPEKCGECCKSKNIYVTVLECIPACLQLWQEGLAEMIISELQKYPEKKECVFYQDNPAEKVTGHCRIYPFRFLVCRLFANSVRFDKDGNPQLMTCKLIKQNRPELYERARKLLGQKLPAPIARDFVFRLYCIDPYLSRGQLPVNIALKRALEITYQHPRSYHKAV